MRFPAIFSALLVLAACSPGGDDAPADPVENAWVRLPAVDGRPAAAYFDLNGGEAGDTLLAIDSPRVETIELHETMEMEGGMDGAMRMQPVMSVEIPADETVSFAPGGLHAMLFDIDDDVTPGTPLTLNFRFDSGRDIQVEAVTIGVGDEPPFSDENN
ncbi:copper chaperone PCu(A)C [uncultured Parasphingopyxis sp.]|uniref:copper chaperone PCu(A)C n=1 Tax=uncultured Parasphingopyxis sp. TaxID=1547918 RepID=UPI0026308760|nr:copper chaperone PCu(A)C [uncultured Parasphingopyxis sp.]